MTRSTKSKGYKELTEKDKRAVLSACLAMRVNGVLPRGSFVKIGKNLALAPKSIGRLWNASKTTRATGIRKATVK